MFTVSDPRPTPTAPVDLPQVKTGPGGPGASRAPRASRLSRTAPEVMRGHHASLLAALREEDTDDEFDDDAFAFVPKGQETPSTPRGAHRVFTAGKESTDSPTSPLVTHTKKEPHTMTYGFATPAGDAGGAPRAATPPPPPPDIRVFLSNGASAPVEVLRNQIVTSLTLKLDRDAAESLTTAATTTNAESVSIGFDVGFDPPAAATTRTLLLPESSNLPKIDELSAAGAVEDPAEYRELMLKLGDLRYICIRAATEIGDDGEAREREYWLPLDESQTVADIKTLAAGADLLEPDGPRLLDVAAGETPLNLSATHAGRTLDDASTVSEEGLTHNTVIRLCVRERANVVVKMRGTKDLEVSLTADETAASLRAKLEQMRPGYARDLFVPYPRGDAGAAAGAGSRLFFGGTELRDGPLNAYGVADGATLELRPHTFGVSGISIPGRGQHAGGLRERHSWNSAGATWKPAAAAGVAGSWVSSGSGGGRSVAMGSGFDDSGSTWGSGFGSASSSSSEHHGSPDVARSFDLARRGLAMGKRPQLASGGTGGAYFLRDGDGETCAVFKPADEEPNARNNPRGRVGSGGGEGLRKGTRVGEGASREVAAYLLDHDGFAAVPATSLANLCDGASSGGDGEGKLGSLQAFVRADAEAEELGPGLFPVREVHKITQLDIRLANTDRNAGNILVQKRGGGEGGTGMFLVPIDHGYALPHTLEDVCFEWEFWPQAKIPYDEETKAYIAGLDVERDAALLRSEGIELSPASERVLRVCTVLLQKAAQRGCCPADIAGIMSRPMPNRASDLEKLASRAAAAALAGGEPRAAAAVPSPIVDAWRALDGNAEAESRFLSEYADLLDSYLEGFEPELAL